MARHPIFYALQFCRRGKWRTHSYYRAEHTPVRIVDYYKGLGRAFLIQHQADEFAIQIIQCNSLSVDEDVEEFVI